MKYIFLFFSSLLLILSPLLAFSVEVPHEIAGIKLGSNVEDYQGLEYSNFLKEVVVTDWHGFRKGVISYGICESPGTIVKIRMKYKDSSQKFHNELFKKFKQKFGTPTEWKGDSFGVRKIWKWKFTDAEGELVSMILKYNPKDPDDDIGNVVKLSFPAREELERLCFIEKCEKSRDSEDKMRKELLEKSDWSFLLPQ
jgi:hypothetical protein